MAIDFVAISGLELIGGGEGIRTLGALLRRYVFNTVAFDYSATPPDGIPPREYSICCRNSSRYVSWQECHGKAGVYLVSCVRCS